MAETIKWDFTEAFETWYLDIGQYYIGLDSFDKNELQLFQVIGIDIKDNYRYDDDPYGLWHKKVYVNSKQSFIVMKENGTIDSFWYITELRNDKCWFRYRNVYGAKPLMVIPKGATYEEALIILEASRFDLLKHIRENNKNE